MICGACGENESGLHILFNELVLIACRTCLNERFLEGYLTAVHIEYDLFSYATKHKKPWERTENFETAFINFRDWLAEWLFIYDKRENDDEGSKICDGCKCKVQNLHTDSELSLALCAYCYSRTTILGPMYPVKLGMQVSNLRRFDNNLYADIVNKWRNAELAWERNMFTWVRKGNLVIS